MYQVEFEFLAAEITDEQAQELTENVKNLMGQDGRYKDNEVLALRDAAEDIKVDIYKYHGTLKSKSLRNKFIIPKILKKYPRVTKSTIRNLKTISVSL